jgi:hypothetical protein
MFDGFWGNTKAFGAYTKTQLRCYTKPAVACTEETAGAGMSLDRAATPSSLWQAEPAHKSGVILIR